MIEDLLKLRWEPGGRGPNGVDCVGMIYAYARMAGVNLQDVATPSDRAASGAPLRELCKPVSAPLRAHPNWVLFFEMRGTPCHAGVVLPDGRFLHCLYGGPRIDNDLRLVERLQFRPIGGLPLADVHTLAAALQHGGLRAPGVHFLALLFISVATSLAAKALAPRAPRLGSQTGRYGFDALITQARGDTVLPDLLGTVSTAGNSPYTEPVDKTAAVTSPATQKACKIVIFGEGPMESFGAEAWELRINGLAWDASYWFSSSGVRGFALNPAQAKADCLDGSIDTSTHRPSLTLYGGAYGATVPVDVRAQYIRDFPIYGFNGCAYAVFRLVDSAKYSQFNVMARCRGRQLRTYSATGFVTGTATATPTSTGQRRYALGHRDLTGIASVSHPSAAYTEMSRTNQTGSVFVANKTKGLVEFPDSFPPSGGTITVGYGYYVLAASANPATHILALLTDIDRGRGLSEDRIDFPSFAAARDYCDEPVTTETETGPVTGRRYTTNYLLDQRRPIEEHLRELLGACRGVLLRAAGKIKLKLLREDDSAIFDFYPGNILAGSAAIEQIDVTQRANSIRVQFHDAGAFNAEDTIRGYDPDDQEARALHGAGGVRVEAVKYSAVDSPAQAARLEAQIEAAELDVNWAIRFKTTIKALAIEPGDVITFTHPLQPAWNGKKFRIEEVGLDENDLMEIKATEFISA